MILTADEREETGGSLLDAGATDFVLKPVRPVELVARVRRVLRETARVTRLLSET